MDDDDDDDDDNDNDRQWRMTEAYLSYKHTKWAFGSGELTRAMAYSLIENV